MTLHDMEHSTGLALAQVVNTGEEGTSEYSFRVTLDGQVTELAGWGKAGPLPTFPHPVNVPPNPLRVHTVAVEDDSEGTRRGVRDLIDQHLEKYGECQVYPGAGLGRDLINWCRYGCPEVAGPAPTDEDIVAANRTDGLTRGEEQRADTSFPRPVPERNTADIPDPGKVIEQQVAEARQSPRPTSAPQPAEKAEKATKAAK